MNKEQYRREQLAFPLRNPFWEFMGTSGWLEQQGWWIQGERDMYRITNLTNVVHKPASHPTDQATKHHTKCNISQLHSSTSKADYIVSGYLISRYILLDISLDRETTYDVKILINISTSLDGSVFWLIAVSNRFLNVLVQL
jgi:hypothetical protein